MYNLPGSIYLVLIFVFFQGFLVLLVVFLFIDKFLSARKNRIEAEIIKQDAYKEALKEVEAAKASSYRIVKEAEEKAASIVSQSEFLSTTSQKNFTDSLNKVVSEQSQKLSQIISGLNSELKSDFDKEKVTTLAGFDTVFGDLKKEAVQQLATYKDTLTKYSLDTEETLKTQADSYINEVKTRLSEYERTQTKKVQDNLFNTLLQVSKDFFGNAATVSDHEDLVLKLFKDANLKETMGF